MKEVKYTCDVCGKTSSNLDTWYEVHYHPYTPHHHMIPIHDHPKHWHCCSLKCLIDIRSSKPKANEVRDQVIEDYHEALELLDDEDKAETIKTLKMLKALDNPIRLRIVNFILSKQGESK